jgi:hypothetical protein
VPAHAGASRVVKPTATIATLNVLRVKIIVNSVFGLAPKVALYRDRLVRPLLRSERWQCYRTTPEMNPGLRRGGLISFFKKQ